MEINYPDNPDLVNAPYWQAPNAQMQRELMIPPFTAPYGQPFFWPEWTNYSGADYPILTDPGYDGQSSALVLASFPQGMFSPPTTQALSGLGDATTGCSSLSDWVAANPLLALGAVIGLFALIGRKKK